MGEHGAGNLLRAPDVQAKPQAPGARLSAPSSTPRPPADWLAGLPFTAVTREDGMGVELDIFGQIGQDVAGPDRRSRRRSPSSRSAAGTCDAPGHRPPKCCAAHREYSRPSLPGSVVLANRSRHVTAHRKPDGAGQWRHAPTRLFAPSWPVVEARRLPIRQRPGDQPALDAGAVSPHDLLPWVMSTMRCVLFVCGVRARLSGQHRGIKAALGLRASLRCGRARALHGRARALPRWALLLAGLKGDAGEHGPVVRGVVDVRRDAEDVYRPVRVDLQRG